MENMNFIEKSFFLLEEENKKLKSLCIQKDKEIEVLRKNQCITFNSLCKSKKLQKLVDNRDRIIRKTICNEIRDWYREQDLIMENWLKDCLVDIEGR